MERLLREHPDCDICKVQLEVLLEFSSGEPKSWTRTERNRTFGILSGNVQRHLKSGKHRKRSII